MSDFLDIDQAIEAPGLRLVLSVGVPGPWGEAAKSIFDAKQIPYARVRQQPGLPNEALERWTQQSGAPVAVYEKEAPRSSWEGILLLAERLSPTPRLVPTGAQERSTFFGLAHELCGEWGFGWCRRLMLLHQGMSIPELPASIRDIMERLAFKYGYDPKSAEAAPERVGEILELFGRRLEAQQDRGSRFLLGDALTALDIYWATFATLIEPLPPEQCAISKAMRAQYTLAPAQRGLHSAALLEHRDFIYREYLKLPLEL